MPDGLQQGVIFSSDNTGFTEVCLFNDAYGPVAKGSSFSGTAQVRKDLVELADDVRLPLAAADKRALKALRRYDALP